MYDEDQLFNEVKNITTTGIKIYQNIENMITEAENKAKNIIDKVDNDFVFTGQATDLRYFTDKNTMPMSLINNISDITLRNCVTDEFNHAIGKKLLEVNNNTGMITITDKGKEYIKKQTFRKAVQKDLNSITKSKEQIMGYELEGQISDLNYFNFSEKLNIYDIMSNPDKKAVQSILSNFEKMNESGFIKIDNSVITLTDKGKELLNSSLFKASVQGKTEISAAAAGIPGKIFVVTKNIVSAMSSVSHKR